MYKLNSKKINYIKHDLNTLLNIVARNKNIGIFGCFG